jgi:hypothetical protein
VLKWDVSNEDKGKHEKFNNLLTGPFKIGAYRRNNAYFLKELNGECVGWGIVNERFLKNYMVK